MFNILTLIDYEEGFDVIGIRCRYGCSSIMLLLQQFEES